MSSLKPWREIAIPHDDVLKGTFQQSEFAADLSAVQQQRASEEYQDARLFFDRTYITEGMRLLLETVVKRLSGQGGDPVVQLQTSFGGGKTHTMLAVYHLASRNVPASELHGVSPILDSTGVTELPKARVAVLDGNAMGPNEVRTRGKFQVRTLWGELAWQLGGEEAYKLVQASDEAGTSPGKESLIKLLELCSPSVILIDELVAYIRQLSQETGSSGGTYDANLSFIQALTEAAKQIPDTIILASLPESELEAGGERGRLVLEALAKIFGRIQALWKPVSSEEAFEIVRRRLFKSDIDQSALKAVCGAYIDLYVADSQFPNETRDSHYRDRMEQAYPIHPEFFDRLYQDWSSLEKFQRTRGVLKLMAKVIHRLWKDGNSDHLIMPASLPLYDSDIRTELINYLDNGWEQIIESELDGEKSVAKELDSSKHFGAILAAQRLTRTLFLATAPRTPNQTNRGVEFNHILLGAIEPDQQVGFYKDALNELNDKLHYLTKAGSRYYLDTRPNLRRTMEDRKQSIAVEDVTQFVRTALQQQINTQLFDGIHVFTAHADVPDDTALRLIVLPMTARHASDETTTEATKLAGQFLRQRGDQPRQYANRLIFLASDENSSQTLRDQVKAALAWRSVVADATGARLNLDQLQLKQARETEQHAGEVAKRAVLESYRWLITPIQTAEPGQVGETSMEAHQISATAGISNEIERALREHEDVISHWAPVHLTQILKKWYWQTSDHMNAQQLWEDFCKYIYLPRLKNRAVFEQTIAQAMINADYFGVAYGKDGDKYLDPHVGDGTSPLIDSSLLLVRPEVLNLSAEVVPPAIQITHSDGIAVSDQLSATVTSGSTLKPKRFIGRKTFSHFASAPLDFKELYDEVITHLGKDATSNVKISVDIEVDNSSGFDEHVQRTVKENSRQLNLSEYDFEN